jgi:hypothetical protein
MILAILSTLARCQKRFDFGTATARKVMFMIQLDFGVGADFSALWILSQTLHSP